MCNGDNNKKYGTKADFFQSIAESMVSRTMNWSTMLEQEMSDNNKNSVSDGQTDNGGTSISIQYPTELCVPVPLHALPVTISTKKKVCQICNYEMHTFKWRSVAFCSKHGVRLCTEIVKPRWNVSPTYRRKMAQGCQTGVGRAPQKRVVG